MQGYVNIVRNSKHAPSTFDPQAKPENDKDRVLALERYNIFDTPTEEIFSAYTELAALTLRAPIALMSFVGEAHVYYKESFGIPRAGQRVHRRNSPCTLAILSKEVSVFRYALTDPCVLADEQNREEAGYKFYAGAPLINVEGFSIGVLAVVDRQPQHYHPDDLSRLQTLSAEVMHEIELRFSSSGSQRPDILNQRLRILHERVAALRIYNQKK